MTGVQTCALPISTGYDVGHHFPEDAVRVEKYDSSKVYTVAYWDDTIQKFYLKRFMAEATDKLLSFVDEENPKSRSLCISDEPRPALEVIYGGVHSTKPSDVIDAVEFIGVKGYKAKGKRISTFEIDKVRFIPQHFAPLAEPAESVVEPDEEPIEQEEVDVVELVGAEMESNEPEVEVATEDPAEEPTKSGEVELEIIVPAEEEDDSKEPQITQLDLF